MRQRILNLKFIVLLALFALIIACKDSNDEKICLNYSTKIFETQISYYFKTINNYDKNNPTDSKSIEIKLQADTFYKYYIECKMLIDSAKNTSEMSGYLHDFHAKTRKYFIKCHNYPNNSTIFIDTLHTTVFSSKEAINNICAIEMYYVINEIKKFTTPPLYLDISYYRFYPISDTIRINDLYTGLILHETTLTRNRNIDKYKIISIKRNGVKINENDIQIQFKDNKFSARADKAGKYEVNLILGSDVEYSKMNNKCPLKIEFVVTE